MLSSIHRLTKKNDFDVVFTQGKSKKVGFVLCKALRTSSKSSRFAFVVSKKISPKATVRNKVRRRLRSALAKRMDTISQPVDVVFIALFGIQNQEFAKLDQDMAKLVTSFINTL